LLCRFLRQSWKLEIHLKLNKPKKGRGKLYRVLKNIKITIMLENHTKLEKDIKADKTLRVSLDKNLQELKELPSSRERSLSITKLQEAIMWLGMDLKRLNEPNPYPDSYKPENAKIAPTADGLKL